MRWMRALVQKRVVAVRADAEDLHPAAVDEFGERPDHALTLVLPFVAVAGGEREQRGAPVTEDGDAHFVAETR